jgi:hypothetical protein
MASRWGHGGAGDPGRAVGWVSVACGRIWTWPPLMHRVFALACPRCGGRLRVIATVQDPLAVQAILAHIRRSGAPEPPSPAPPASAAIG